MEEEKGGNNASKLKSLKELFKTNIEICIFKIFLKRWKSSGLEIEDFFQNIINSASLQRNHESSRKCDEYERRLVIDETPSKTGGLLTGSIPPQESSVENYAQQIPDACCSMPTNGSGPTSSSKHDKQIVGYDYFAYTYILYKLSIFKDIMEDHQWE